MKKSLLYSAILLALSTNSFAMVTSPYLEFQGGIISFPDLNSIFESNQPDSIVLPTARLGGGFNWQVQPDSRFFFGLNSHINTAYTVPYFDANLLLGTHLNDKVDLSLKLGADVIFDHYDVAAIPRLGAGVDYKLNNNWTVTGEIATECILIQTAWIGFRYTFN